MREAIVEYSVVVTADTTLLVLLEFHIPLSREDLLRQGDRSQCVVSECCTAAEVASRLEGTTWLAVSVRA